MKGSKRGVVIDRLMTQGLITEELVKRADKLQNQSGSHMFIGEALINVIRSEIEEILNRERLSIDKLADVSRGHRT